MRDMAEERETGFVFGIILLTQSHSHVTLPSVPWPPIHRSSKKENPVLLHSVHKGLAEIPL
jgi:hypothetical protein